MDSTAIKLEPGTSAEESVAVTCTEIDIDYPLIKNECSDYFSENISGEISTTQLSHLDGVTIKTEPEMKDEEESAISYIEIDIELPDVKKDCLEHSDRILQTSGPSGVKNTTSVLRKGVERESNNSKYFPCTRLNKKITSKQGLIAHFLTHFKEKTLLAQNKEKSLSCSYCNYSCSLKSNLSRHTRTQTEEKPFSCSYCNYSCSQKSQLIAHIPTHTKGKPFSCSYCDYTCSCMSTLTKHFGTHSKEKPFSCSNCIYACSQKSDLTMHMRTHC